MRLRTIDYTASQADDRFTALTRLCWGFVPLATAIVFSLEDDGGNLVAFAELGQLEHDPGTVLLFGDAVHPGHRRRGLHARLIAERVSYARELGSRRCVATTYGPESTSARNYRRAGFRVGPWIPDGPAEWQTEWILDLAPTPTASRPR